MMSSRKKHHHPLTLVLEQKMEMKTDVEFNINELGLIIGSIGFGTTNGLHQTIAYTRTNGLQERQAQQKQACLVVLQINRHQLKLLHFPGTKLVAKAHALLATGSAMWS